MDEREPLFDVSADAAVGPSLLSSDETMPDHSASKERRFLFGKREDKSPADKPRAKKRVPPMPRAGIKQPLEDLYTTFGALYSPLDPVCGSAIIQAAPNCAESLDRLARQNPAVRRVLLALIDTNTWGAVLAAHAPIVMAIAMHHVPAVQKVMAERFAEAVSTMNGSGPDSD